MVREERVSLQHSWNLLTDGLPRLCGDGYSHQRKLRRQELLLDHGRCGALALGHGGNRAAYGGGGDGGGGGPGDRRGRRDSTGSRGGANFMLFLPAICRKKRTKIFLFW